MKEVVAKHKDQGMQWDQLLPMATAAYNFFPNQTSQESPFFLMYGRDPLVPLLSLLEPQPRYVGDELGRLNLQEMQRIYSLVAAQIKFARERRDKKPGLPSKRDSHLQIGDAVHVKNYVARGFDPKYKADYRVIGFKGPNVIEVKDSTGRLSTHHITNVKKTTVMDKIADVKQQLQKFGRQPRYLQIRLNNECDLGWDPPPVTVDLAETYNMHIRSNSQSNRRL